MSDRTYSNVSLQQIADGLLVLSATFAFYQAFMHFVDGGNFTDPEMLKLQALGLVLAFMGTMNDGFNKNIVVRAFKFAFVFIGSLAGVAGLILGIPWIISVILLVPMGDLSDTKDIGLIFALPLYAFVPGAMSLYLSRSQ